jgi:hypothetical protein
VYHEVQVFGLTVAAGGPTTLDFVLPEMSMKGNCTKTTCKLHVSVGGFDPFDAVEVYLQGWTIEGSVGTQFPQVDLGSLTCGASGAAKGAFTFDRPPRGTYHLAAAGQSEQGDGTSVYKTTYSPETLMLLDKPDVVDSAAEQATTR